VFSLTSHRSVYLTSARSGSLEIWRLPLEGGQAVRLTRSGGAESAVSPDGRVVYYTKVPEVGPGLWSVASGGGQASRRAFWIPSAFSYWAVARGGM
jgi:Tol biopolymer transport system component